MISFKNIYIAFAIVAIALSVNNEAHANNYSANQNLHYSYSPQTSQGCNVSQGTQGFRPIRRLAERIRTFGLGRQWIPMGNVPRESKQRKIGKGVARWQWGQAVCSATMITPHHAMLNYHCFTNRRQRKFGNKTLTFNYEDGMPRNQMRKYSCNKVIMVRPDLDMAIIECEGAPGNTFGFAELERGQPARGTKSFTVHHPSGGTKKYSEGTYYPYNNHTAGMTQIIIPGSSGSSTYDANSGKMIMLNNKYNWRQDRFGRGSGDKAGRGIKTSYIVAAIEGKFGKDFLPKSGGNAVHQQAPYIAQTPQGINQPSAHQLGQRTPIANPVRPVAPRINSGKMIAKNRPHMLAPTQPSVRQVQRPQRRLITNYNQAPIANQRPIARVNQGSINQGSINQGSINQGSVNQGTVNQVYNPSKSGVQRSIAKNVFVKNNGSYLNMSAFQKPVKPVTPQIAQNNNQGINRPATPRKVIQLHNGNKNVPQNNQAYRPRQNSNNNQAYNPRKAPVNKPAYQAPKTQRQESVGPIRQMFRNMASRIRGRRYRRNRGPDWTPISNIPQDTAIKQVAKSVGKFITYDKPVVSWENGVQVTSHPQGSCTATLIGPEHAILNSHCIGHKSRMYDGEMVFGYEKGGRPEKYKCSEVVLRDDVHDMLIVKCKGRPGDKYGFVELEEKEVPRGTETYIVHHPNGTPKQYSEGKYVGYRNLSETLNRPEYKGHIKYRAGTTSAYITEGSSGSLTFSAKTNKAIMLNNSTEGSEHGHLPALGLLSSDIVKVIKRRLGPNFLPKPSNGSDSLASYTSN